MSLFPVYQPSRITPMRVVAVVVNALIGLVIAAFFITFVGLNPAHATECDVSDIMCTDDTPDYQLLVAIGMYQAASVTSTHFEDMDACIAAGDAAKKYLVVGQSINVLTVCVPESSK